jgi:hypothetical protein
VCLVIPGRANGSREAWPDGMNPEIQRRIWIPGSREDARPGMTGATKRVANRADRKTGAQGWPAGCDRCAWLRGKPANELAEPGVFLLQRLQIRIGVVSRRRLVGIETGHARWRGCASHGQPLPSKVCRNRPSARNTRTIADSCGNTTARKRFCVGCAG